MPEIYRLLEVCLDTGLPEKEFWNMTLGEVMRHIESYNRREESRAKEKAVFYYRLAELIGISDGRYYSKDFVYPEIYEVFDTLFSEEEIETKRQEDRDAKSIERLMAFYENKKK